MAEHAVVAERKRAFEVYDLVVEKTEDLTPRNKGLRFRLPPGKELNFKAGQFAQLFVPHNGKIRRTSYSIASPPRHKDFFDLCVTLVPGGASSTYLHAMKAGDRIQAMAPLGTFSIKDESRDFVFIATGSGIAPFRSMIHDLLDRNTTRTLHLIFGNRFEEDILYRREWEDLAKEHGRLKVLFTLSRADSKWPGERGYVQEKIAGFIPDLKEKNYLICGLVNMINAVQDKLLSLGVPKGQIHFERYD
ncbi:MAG: FAD-dependent oxidoreductase [Elusimicrobia bacterium]|nr:FAD-dependent oxidoreductase [Elusimicrobiota bacterium]